MTRADRFKYLASVAMLLLAYGAIAWGSDGDSQREPILIERIPASDLRVDSLLGKLRIIDPGISDVLEPRPVPSIVFVLDVATCPPCIFEVKEYLDLLDEFGTPSPPAVILVDPDSLVARRFSQVLNLGVMTLFATGEELPPTLMEGVFRNRMWLSAAESGEPLAIFSLPGGGTTSVQNKLDVLSRHAKALGHPEEVRMRIESFRNTTPNT